MSNNDPLTRAEFEDYRPHPTMIDGIERCRSSFGAAKADFRILDWGCGRGTFVLWLRERGYDAAGADIDTGPFARGAELFRSMGHVVEDCLHGLRPDGTAPFADASFHYVTSWQTIEHIEDLDAAAREWRRLTTNGGGGFHVYPPHRRLVEPHLFMPLVHWLPKTEMRRRLIALFVLLGIEPNWWPDGGVTWREKVRIYYRYSVDETFYRSSDVVRGCLAMNGFETEFVDVEAYRSSRKTARKWLGSSASSRLVRSWYLNYGDDLGLATSLNQGTAGWTPAR